MPQKVVLDGDLPVRFILLGEDDPDDQDMLKEIFGGCNKKMELWFVNTGNAVLPILEKADDTELPSLIVLDYNMPEANGAEILRQLATNPRYTSIPKIVWSTSGADKFRSVCLELGATDYIIKPSNIEELKRVSQLFLSYC